MQNSEKINTKDFLIAAHSAGSKSETYPTTTDLSKKRGYNYIGNLFKEYGLRGGRGGKYLIEPLDFFNSPDCPAPIFNWKVNYFYPVDQETALRIFIVKRKAELGL